jgi:hypothetical protein
MGVYWGLVSLSDSLGVSVGEALREAVESAHKDLDDGDESDDQRGLLARVAAWLSRSPTVEQEYNIDFLTEQQFRYLTASETANGVEMQCRLCGRLFTNEVEECYSHIAGHEEHITQNIDPFQTSSRLRDTAPPEVRTAHVSKQRRERDVLPDLGIDTGGGGGE